MNVKSVRKSVERVEVSKWSEPEAVVGDEPETGVSAVTVQKARKRRRDAGQTLLTARDVAVLRWVGEQTTVRLDLIQRLLGRAAKGGRPGDSVGHSGAYEVLQRWDKLGLVETAKPYYREPWYVWLTRLGLDLVRLPYAYHKPRLDRLSHFHWTAEVRYAVETKHGSRLQEWKSERAIVPEGTRRGDRHYADAEIRFDDVPVAVEVELTRKSAVRLRGIVLELLAHECETVWYFTNGETRPGVEKCVRELRAEARLPRHLREKANNIQVNDLPTPASAVTRNL